MTQLCFSLATAQCEAIERPAATYSDRGLWARRCKKFQLIFGEILVSADIRE